MSNIKCVSLFKCNATNMYLASIINFSGKLDGNNYKNHFGTIYISSPMKKNLYIGISTLQTSSGIVTTTLSKADVLNNMYVHSS